MRRWTVVEQQDFLLLHRTGPAPEWVVEVSRTLNWPSSPGQRLRVAHQVRQDIWRACRSTRGFVPVVQVSTDGHQTVIRAGGSLTTRSGHIPAIEARIAAVLDSENNRRRWRAYAIRAPKRGRGEG